MLAQAQESDTPLQQQLDSLAKRLALVALVVASTLFGFALFQGKPWMSTAFTAIALAVAAIPEGLPAVVTVTLALGMHRMAKQKAIIKRMAAVETLGCTTVICTDKTGTLTVNQMTVRQFYYQAKHYQVTGEGYQAQGEIQCDEGASDDLSALLQPLCLCNNSDWQNHSLGDPLEAALLVLVEKAGMNYLALTRDWLRVAEIPFAASYKLMATFHKDSANQTLRISVKGAPEVILKRCSQALGENAFACARLLNENTRMAATGQRVIAVAERVLALNDYDLDCDLFDYLTDLNFVGLISLIDPPRAEASVAIKRCHQAGIAVKMITGDQKSHGNGYC
ncbi:HAD-IC family P-type ATPase [Methylocucumis oryzae]|uniref:HAD-IC family P-type ATPase n=1 Tax=Methylocucumis oryzae TaxID=1632867 RepID=UPI0006960EBD|nr:HAD-IC family P-type ATPase [Methylocucumis oryzae]